MAFFFFKGGSGKGRDPMSPKEKLVCRIWASEEKARSDYYSGEGSVADAERLNASLARSESLLKAIGAKP
jgi:hypothetical protein